MPKRFQHCWRSISAEANAISSANANAGITATAGAVATARVGPVTASMEGFARITIACVSRRFANLNYQSINGLVAVPTSHCVESSFFCYARARSRETKKMGAISMLCERHATASPVELKVHCTNRYVDGGAFADAYTAV